MRKIKVTEENFTNIITKLQNICNKYKMYSFTRVTTHYHNKCKNRNESDISFRRKYVRKGYLMHKTILPRIHRVNRYVRVTKHHFREAFENDPTSWSATRAYPETRSLIYLGVGPGPAAITLAEGDKILFLPFGIFVMWVSGYVIDEPFTTYKHIFIPDIIHGKIGNLDIENVIRDTEIDNEREEYNHQYSPDEYEYEECYDEDDYPLE